MVPQTEESELKDWLSVLYCTDNTSNNYLSDRWQEYRSLLICLAAGNFYSYIKRAQHLFTSPFSLEKEYSQLTEKEKAPWNDFALSVPGKLRSLKLFIRPWTGFCRTCLIPFEDLRKFAGSDYEKIFFGYILSQRSKNSFHLLSDKEKRFYTELNHLIPLVLKQAGFELVRPEEISSISDKMVWKLARTIHSRYRHEMKTRDIRSGMTSPVSGFYKSRDEETIYISEFDELPDDIKFSNLDNAVHIPAKLLSAGYGIRPVKKGFKPSALRLSEPEIETMAGTEHLRWCWDKILNGWVYGEKKDNRKKRHPSLIDYKKLDESEKNKDRELVSLIPSLLQDINYEAYPLNPGKICKLPYAIRPHSSIHKILDEIRRINSQIRKRVSLTPALEKIISLRNSNIEEAINEIESSYNYARHIQEVFLPDNLYVRECFPESFILFKPKDIVSGDLYFFSRKKNTVIFAIGDCTGHGIPGALLSIIAYGILDQAVNELNLQISAEILNHLYTKIHRFFRHDEEESGISDDLDTCLCILNTDTNNLEYSGTGIPLYRLSGGEIIEYKPGNNTELMKADGKYSTTSVLIKVNPGDILYLFTDGFSDQFGGKHHKRFRTGRLKDLLIEIRDLSMPEQSDRLYEEFEKWRNEKDEEQTDDILIAGIRV